MYYVERAQPFQVAPRKKFRKCALELVGLARLSGFGDPRLRFRHGRVHISVQRRDRRCAIIGACLRNAHPRCSARCRARGRTAAATSARPDRRRRSRPPRSPRSPARGPPEPAASQAPAAAAAKPRRRPPPSLATHRRQAAQPPPAGGRPSHAQPRRSPSSASPRSPAAPRLRRGRTEPRTHARCVSPRHPRHGRPGRRRARRDRAVRERSSAARRGFALTATVDSGNNARTVSYTSATSKPSDRPSAGDRRGNHLRSARVTGANRSKLGP